MRNKTNILCLFPGPTWRPEQPDFKIRFEMLSEDFEGEIYSWSHAKYAMDMEVGAFRLKALVPTGVPNKLVVARHIFKSALAYNRKSRVDVIICYEAVFTGVIGAVLKRIFGCKLIIELNSSSLRKAILMESGPGLKTELKILSRRLIRGFTLWNTDGIKRLTEEQRQDFQARYPAKKVFGFHDFVPTQIFFDGEKKLEKYFLVIGYPYHRKGIDILVSAFDKVLQKHPDFQLKIIGHRLEEEAKKNLGTWDERVQFIKPMWYSELKPYLLNCYSLIIPSREEGMGRVILEAMASSKAIIGSNVGGIPSLVKHNVNGLLFESEDVDALAERMEMLITDPELVQRLGVAGRQLTEDRYSSQKYVEYFSNMVTEVLAD